MQFSYNWLQEYIDAPLPPTSELADSLGLHSFELEGLEELENGDYLIDWDILPNRSSDCLCYEGVAREIAAVCKLPFKSYLDDLQAPTGEKRTSDMLEFTLDANLVPRATKRYAEGITVGESPAWLRKRLESIGQKSINNIVDITNYVMFTTGQPVHAFDYDKLSGTDGAKQMSIRYAQDGEEVHTLDDGEYTLDSSMLVVADAEKALDIAGVKGGSNSGVDEGTTRVVLSACNYDYKNIRATSRALRLATDASKRYENEVPLCKADRAMALLAHLLETECNARVSVDMVDTALEAADAERMRIGFSLAHTNALLGTELSRQEVAEILGRLDISVEESENGLIAAVPPERLDLQIAQDIIEEIGRLYGYANIPEQPIEEGFPMPVPNSVKQAWYRAGDALVQLGFYEVYNRSLVSNGSVQLANALNSEAGTLRSQLLDGVLARVDKNFTHTDEPKLFEIGKVFTGVAGGVVQEHWSFAGVLGRRKIKDKHKQDVFLQTKGALETAFEAMSVRGIIWEATDSDDVVATLMHNGHTIGQVGVNHWEINFEKLVAAIDNSVSYQAPSRYPTIDRDVAVWVPLDTPVQAVADLIASAGAEKCIDTSLFDVYEDADNSRKSVGFRLVFQCWEQTLSDEFANQQMEKIYNILKTQDGFEIR